MVLTAVDCFNVNMKMLLSSNASVTAYHSARHYTEETLKITSIYDSVQSNSMFDEICIQKGYFCLRSGRY